MNGCLLCLGPSKEVRECLCGSKPGARCPGDSRQEAGAALRALGGAAKTLKFYRYGAQAVNTIKFEED